MKVFYDSSFQSLVKACILREVKGYVPVNQAFDDALNARDFNLNELFVEWDWKYGTPRNVNGLEGAVQLAERHKFCTPDLLFSVIREALSYGIDYVLTRKSVDGRRFCNYVLAVREELRSAKSNIRFTRYGNFMLGKYLFNHDISDLLRDFYQKRFPEKKVMIVGLEHDIPDGVAMKSPVPIRGIASQVIGVQVPQSMSLNAFM